MDGFSGFSLFLMFLHLAFCCTEGAQVFITAAEREECVLPCSGRKGVQVLVLQWTRFSLDRDLLLVYRVGKVLHGYEDSDYTNRVELLDPQPHSRDLSVVLKEVTFKDSGKYQCYAFYEDGQETVQSIHLTVKGRGADVSAAEGEDCVLPCSDLFQSSYLSDLEWTRFDPYRDLLMFRDGKVLNGYKDPLYTNRVELLDPQLHRGDLSLVLKEVTLEDSGTYECWALYKDKHKISQIISLRVTERDGRLFLGLSTGLWLILVIAVLCYFNKKLTRLQRRLTTPPSAIII